LAAFVSLAARVLERGASRVLGHCVRIPPDPRDPEIDRLRMELVAAGRRLGAEERRHVEEDDRADVEIERLRRWLELISDDCVQVGHTEGGRFVPHDHSASFARRTLAGEQSPLQDGEDDG
jgi:hypothetical protein